MSTPPIPPPPPQSPYIPPLSGGAPPPPRGDRIPWEERDRLGLVEAFIQTIRLLVTDPSNAFSRLRPDSDLVSPILFGLIVSWFGFFLSQMWDLMFGGLARALLSGIEGVDPSIWAPGTFMTFGALVVFPLLYIVGIFVSSGIVHLCLMLVGATADSPTGFEGTIKVIAYSQVGSLAGVVPFVGSVIAVLWMLVLEVIGFAFVHRTTQGRALLAVLIPILLCCTCLVIGAAVFGAMIGAVIGSMTGSGVTP